MPPATAVVNGDSRGSKNRTYGSSDVSRNRSVSSASISSVSAMRPAPETDETRRRRFEIERQQLAAQSRLSGELADAFVAGEQVVDARA